MLTGFLLHAAAAATSSLALAAAMDALAESTDFSNAVFNKEQVASAVVSQYDDDKTRLFYKIVMGAPRLSNAANAARSAAAAP